ncbi:MAG: hypothetical protein Q7S22_08795 [Candidatus Micrarchaeota archaeon]|nr:hypothetical protein [Candidatus Micrarchaeota archaeon]
MTQLSVAQAKKPRMKVRSFSFKGRTVNLGALTRKNYDNPESFEQIHPLIDRFNSANRTHLQLVRPQVVDAALRDEHACSFVEMCEPVATNAIVAYSSTGKRFPRFIEHDEAVKLPEVFLIEDQWNGARYVLPSGKYAGEKGIALVVIGLNSRDFQTGRSPDEVIINVSDDRIIPVRNFPIVSSFFLGDDGEAMVYDKEQRHNFSAWFFQDRKTTLPCGRTPVDYRKGAVQLRLSMHKTSLDRDFCVTTIAREWGLGAIRSTIDLSNGPLSKYHALVEIPERDLSRIEVDRNL